MKRKHSKDYAHSEPICWPTSNSVPGPECRAVERMTVRKVHYLAVQALRHFAKHGDNTQMSRLSQSLVTPTWKKALLEWFERYARIQWIKGRNGFRGGPHKDGVRIPEAERKPFRRIPKYDLDEGIGVRVDILWSTPYESLRPCRDCGARSLPGEHTCYGHHNK